MSEEIKFDFEYSGDTKFDINALEVEWTKHPRKYEKWSKALTIMTDRVKTATDNFDRVYAELDLHYRNEFKDQKTTEAIIKHHVILDKKYIEAQEKLNKLVYQMNMVKNVLSSVDRIKPALENEVKLLLGNYFAGPKEPRDLSKVMNMQEKWQERAEEKREEVSNDIKSRRRRRTAE
jgi:hypothetical protein